MLIAARATQLSTGHVKASAVLLQALSLAFDRKYAYGKVAALLRGRGL